MRNLFILRGVPGAGKSTWIKEAELERYTISSDELRLIFSGITKNPETGLDMISQKRDKYVWKKFFDILEDRMSKGETIFLDATHNNSKSLKVYNKLIEIYGYDVYIVDFDVPLEECLERNKYRGFRSVPEEVIQKMYNNIKNTETKFKIIKPSQVFDIIYADIDVEDLNKYDNVVLFGDIHGCYDEVSSYFRLNPVNPKTYYIFLGDFIDRGPENGMTLDFLMFLSESTNVTFLEGNHERWLRYYAFGHRDKIASNVFLEKTMPQLERASVYREFCNNLKIFKMFKFDGNLFLATHGGVGKIPEMLDSADSCIKGVGGYKDIETVHKTFSRNYACTNVIQVHGHRSSSYESTEDKRNYNLNSGIENGESLKILKLSKK